MKQIGRGALTYFLYDGTAPVCELSSTGSLLATNTFGANGLVSRHTAASEFYAFDPQGSVTQRLNKGGTATSPTRFDAFGMGATPRPWGYGAQSGGYTDETNLVPLGHRYYDPSLGRFINRDPIGYAGAVNLYSCTGNDPVNEDDPDGTRKYKIHNSNHRATSQNADDVFSHLGSPTTTYDHQTYLIDVPDNQNLDRNLADARRFNRLLQSDGLSYAQQLQIKHAYLEHFCGNNGVGDYGKNLALYPDSDPKKNNFMYWERRLGGNFNLGAMGGALGFSESSLLASGHTLSVVHWAGLHRQIEQDAIEDGFRYQLKH